MNKILIIVLLVFVPLIAMAQASGGQIKRKTPKQNTETSKKPTKSADKSIVNGHKAVNLGLSVRWATCNVGASKPEEYGNYYAWGETKPKSDYSWATYFDIGNIQQGLYGYTQESFKKYSSINNYKLSMEDDVASMKWGSSWRIPTKDEFEELWSLPHRWEIVNGIQGMKFTSSNGHSIFLPAAGAKKYKELKEEGGVGIYWTSEVFRTDHDTSDCGVAWVLEEEHGGWGYLYRFQGMSIRAVTK